MNADKIPFGLQRQVLFACVPFLLFSVIAFVLGALWDPRAGLRIPSGGDPQRTWANLLVVSYYLFGLGVGGALFLALLQVTGARWSTPIQPALIRLTDLLPVGAVGIVLVLVARSSLYPWTSWTGGDQGGSTFQAFWLNRPFFLCRTLLYLFGLWTMTSLVVRAARQEANEANKTRLSAVFLVVFAFICWLASTDWIMSLEPKWSSTIFGVYNFSGIFLGVLAAAVVLAGLRGGNLAFTLKGYTPPDLSKKQFGDLGTLLFAFSSFWMYIWFSQYMLIWYVNNPEEAEYFVLRQHGPWQTLFLANLVLNWGVPFVVLLFRPAKENPGILMAVAVTVLVGRFLDLYLMVLPPLARGESVFGFWDGCLIPGSIALAILILTRNPSSAMVKSTL